MAPKVSTKESIHLCQRQVLKSQGDYNGLEVKNFEIRLGPVWTNSMECVAHTLLSIHSQKDWLIPLFIIISDNFVFIFSQVH